MATFNKVTLLGNLTRDPELKSTPSGVSVATFGLAVNHKYKQGENLIEEVCFVDITVWKKQAENCKEYLKKGSAVLIDGRLNFSTWEKEGQKRNKLDVVAGNVQFLSKRQEQEQEQNQEEDSNQGTGITAEAFADVENQQNPGF